MLCAMNGPVETRCVKLAPTNEQNGPLAVVGALEAVTVRRHSSWNIRHISTHVLQKGIPLLSTTIGKIHRDIRRKA